MPGSTVKMVIASSKCRPHREKSPMGDEDPLDQLNEICNIFDGENMRFWVDGGTLLGLYRDNKLLDSDPDIDISVIHSDKSLVSTLLKKTNIQYKIQTKTYNGNVVSYKLIPDKQSHRQVDIKVFQKGKFIDGSQYYWTPIPNISFNSDSTLVNTVRKGVKYVFQFANRNKSGNINLNSVILKPFVTIGSCLIPSHHLNDFTNIGDKLRAPQKIEKYLTYRFGNWQVPDNEWYYWEDDNSILHCAPEAILAIY